MAVSQNWTQFNTLRDRINATEFCRSHVQPSVLWATHFTIDHVKKGMVNKDTLLMVMTRMIAEELGLYFGPDLEALQPIYDFISRVSERSKDHFGLPIPVAMDIIIGNNVGLKHYLLDKQPSTNPNNWFNYNPDRFSDLYEQLLYCMTGQNETCNHPLGLSVAKHERLFNKALAKAHPASKYFSFCAFGNELFNCSEKIRFVKPNCFEFNGRISDGVLKSSSLARTNGLSVVLNLGHGVNQPQMRAAAGIQ